VVEERAFQPTKEAGRRGCDFEERGKLVRHGGIIQQDLLEERGALGIRERVHHKGPLSVGEAVQMLQEVAWALGHAHGRGVVHRDVKPDNVMLETAGGRAMVTDFGIARTDARPALTAARSLLGTPEYVNPEQSRAAKSTGARSSTVSAPRSLPVASSAPRI
jgi:serine/threonine protein kinase